MANGRTERKNIEEQEKRRRIKDEFKKNGNPNATGDSPHRKRQEELRAQRENKIKNKAQNKNRVNNYYNKKESAKKRLNQNRVNDYYKKKQFVKDSIEISASKDRKDLINRIMNNEMTEADYIEQTRIEELSRKANDKSISKSERKKARKELAKERNNPLYSANLNKEWQEKEIIKANSNIESKNRDVVENYLDKKYNINENVDSYNQFNKDLEVAGSDYLDMDGNEVGRVNKFINKTFKKAELKVKGFFKGDYSEYDEYVEAVGSLENMNARDFELYDTDNLFNSRGHLNNADDLDNIKPTRTTTARETYDHWQQQRMYNRVFNTANTTSVNTSNGSAISKENLLRSHPNAKKLFTAQGVFGVGMNLFNTVSTYKEERKEGKSVLGSAARAGIDFALGEVLGMKYMGVMAAQALPRMAVKGLEGLGQLTREKNNMQRHEAFGYASFQDTQQLATMRQSGMEMAKMANYNLQQTLMGNEAKYMHR